MSEIVDFLNAQYDKHEQAATGADDSYNDVDGCWGFHEDPAYVLADIESKRRIMTEIVEQIDGMDAQLECEFGTGSSDRAAESEKLLQLLAAPFAGEPGYDQKWAA